MAIEKKILIQLKSSIVKTMRALITGFEGFAGKVNPSGIIAKSLDGKQFGNLEVTGRELPEDFYALPKVLRSLILQVKPDIVISTGWDYISSFKVEKIALNVMNSRFGEKKVPDNAGNSPLDEKIIARGSLALQATMPVEKIINDLSNASIAANISYHAGTHCCNTVMYLIIFYSRQVKHSARSGFIHLPPIPEMKIRAEHTESMSLSQERRGIELALLACQDKRGRK